MTTITPGYGSAVSLACTTTALASDGNLLAGRQSAIANNTTDLAVDTILEGTIATSGTITAGTIELWAFASIDNTNFTGGASSAGDANLSLPTTGMKALMQKLDAISVDTTARTYVIGPYSVANAFGGTMPAYWGFFVVHNLGSGVLTTTLKYLPVKYNNA